jgi:two-component system phosphate regulon sensor histidine kinase PhoR
LAVLVLAGVVVLCASTAAFLLLHDLDVFARSLRRIMTDEESGTPSRAAVLGSSGPVIDEIERLAGWIAERNRLLERLRQADDRILECLPDPLIVLARDRSTRRVNAAARAAYGADLAALLRHPVMHDAISRAFDEMAPQSAELRLGAPARREVLATVVPMPQPLSDGGELIAVLSDRTRERAAERMRVDFVANVSHELRTPLASLVGFIDTLRGPAANDPAAQIEFLGIMAEQAARMGRLVDDLLSLSRIEMLEHHAPTGVADLADLVRSQMEGFAPRFAERNMSPEVAIADVLPPVRGDGDQIAQVLQNLVDNAIKYGRQGGMVRLEARSIFGDEDWPAAAGVLLRVRDDGSGIPAGHLPRLTERFYRVDKGRSRSAGGTGLGLAIVKHIVNRHRGRLLIESTEGNGTTVSVWLPQAE